MSLSKEVPIPRDRAEWLDRVDFFGLEPYRLEYLASPDKTWGPLRHCVKKRSGISNFMNPFFFTGRTR